MGRGKGRRAGYIAVPLQESLCQAIGSTGANTAHRRAPVGRSDQALVPHLSPVISWRLPRKRMAPAPVLPQMLMAATPGNLATHLAGAAPTEDHER